MTRATGQVLQNRYRIVSLLGQGGMGAVYRAWDARLDVPVALKEMRPQPGLDPHTLAQIRQQFQREANVLARLDHPHLVGVTDFFEEGGNVYLVMKFIEGESLAQRIKREGTLPEERVLAWADQLLDALVYCHSQGVLHRDVKPHNVIIRPDGRAVLVDFGLVKLWDPRDPRTRTAMRGMGTPEYAPPEQYDPASGHTDARADVYGLGATMYHTLVGRAPPTATQRIVNPAALAPVRTLNPRVSPHVETVLMQALELQPEARFQSAAGMRSALRGGPPATPPPRRAPGTLAVAGPRPTPQRRASPWTYIGVAAGVLLLAAVLLGGFALVTALLPGDRSASLPAVTEALATATSEAEAEGAIVATDVATAVATGTPTSPPPTATPAHAASPGPTAEPAATSQLASTPAPTPTPQPTHTPLPTETATPACPAVSGPFASVWQEAQERLGCAVNQSHTTWMAEEHFERGRMFWREDTDLVYVLYNNGGWASYQNTWHEGDPGFSCPDSAPEESPPTPVRGFGKVWCTYETVRSGLGWATNQEHGDHVTAQDFERASGIRMNDGTIYVLYDNGQWEQW